MKEIQNLSYFDPLIPYIKSIGRKENCKNMFVCLSIPNWFKIDIAQMEEYFNDVHFTYNEQDGYTGLKGEVSDDRLAYYFLSSSTLKTKQ